VVPQGLKDDNALFFKGQRALEVVGLDP